MGNQSYDEQEWIQACELLEHMVKLKDLQNWLLEERELEERSCQIIIKFLSHLPLIVTQSLEAELDPEERRTLNKLLIFWQLLDRILSFLLSLAKKSGMRQPTEVSEFLCTEAYLHGFCCPYIEKAARLKQEIFDRVLTRIFRDKVFL